MSKKSGSSSRTASRRKKKATTAKRTPPKARKGTTKKKVAKKAARKRVAKKSASGSLTTTSPVTAKAENAVIGELVDIASETFWGGDALTSVVNESQRLARAYDSEDLCELVLNGQLGRKTLRFLVLARESPLTKNSEDRIRETLEGQGADSKYIDSNIDLLRDDDIPPYRQYLNRVEDACKEIDKTKAALEICQAAFGQDLGKRYSDLKDELHEKFTPENIDVEQEFGSFLQLGAGLAGAGDIVGVVKTMFAWFRKYFDSANKKSALIKTIRAALLIQLDPESVREVGLQLSQIRESYGNYDQGKMLDETGQRAVYCVVKQLLQLNGEERILRDLIEAHGLTKYTRLHGRLMDQQFRLIHSTSVWHANGTP